MFRGFTGRESYVSWHLLISLSQFSAELLIHPVTRNIRSISKGISTPSRESWWATLFLNFLMPSTWLITSDRGRRAFGKALCRAVCQSSSRFLESIFVQKPNVRRETIWSLLSKLNRAESCLASRIFSSSPLARLVFIRNQGMPLLLSLKWTAKVESIECRNITSK